MLHTERRGLDELPDDHAGPRRDGRSAVGDDRRIGLDDVDVGAVDAERLRRDLRKDRVRALTDLGAGGQDADRAVRRALERDDRSQVDFAGPGETGSSLVTV